MSLKPLLLTVSLAAGAAPALAQPLPVTPAPLGLAPAAARAPMPARIDPGLRLQRPAAEAALPPAPREPMVDDSALRFYAAQGDATRVAAEIRRLKSLHPAWQPPQDLFSGSTVILDEQPLWALFAEKRYDEMRERIAALQTEHPGYLPSSELITQLARAERRAAVVAASDDKDWAEVVELALEAQDLLTCREIDVLWRVAEAFSGLKEAERAVEVYRYVLVNCDNPRERLATVQKAAALLPQQPVRDLIAMGKRRPGGSGEFDAVGLDLIRRGIGEAAAGQSLEAPAERDLRTIETTARRGNAEDAGLLGWYAYSRKDHAAARDWFALAAKASDNPKHIEGLVLATRNLGDLARAESLAWQHREADPLIRKAWLEIVASEISAPAAAPLESERLARISEMALREKSALGAQALGWNLYHAGRFAEARGWFERSIGWAPAEEAAVGLIVADQRLGNRRAAAETIQAWKDRYPAVAALARLRNAEPLSAADARRMVRRGRGASGGVVRETVALYEAGKYREAAAMLDRHAGRMPSGMTELRAWSHFNAGNYEAAGKIFSDLKRTTRSRNAEYGKFLSDIHARGDANRWFN